MSKIIKIIDERETQKQTTNKQKKTEERGLKLKGVNSRCYFRFQ